MARSFWSKKPVRRFAHRLPWAITATGLALAMPRQAGAQDAAPPHVSEATTSDEDLLAQGVDLRKRGQDAEALAAFQRAYELHASARALAQIALAHQALGNWREAEHELLDALGHGDDAWIARQRPHLEAGLVAVRRHLAWLSLESNVPGAEVWIAGEFAGRLPMREPLRVVSDRETLLEVRAPGYEPISRALQIDAGLRMTQVFTFVAQPPASPLPPVETEGPGPPPHGDVQSPGARRAGWIALTAAGAFLLVGIGGAVTREWEARIYDDNEQCGPVPGQSRRARCGTNRDIGSAAEVVAIVAFAGSGVSAVTAAALLTHGGRASAPAHTTQLHCGFEGLRLGCAGTF